MPTSPAADAIAGTPGGSYAGPGQSAGPAIDRTGTPVVDPTANVLGLVEAAVTRLNDLREAESKRIDDIAGLRADYDEKLRDAESKRIDAIRAVDVGAVSRAAEVAATQATTLATQVAASAEALRAQVATTATAFRAELSAALEPIQKRIDDLTRVQYESVGSKTQVTEGRDQSKAIYALGGFLISLMFAAIAIVGFVVAAK